MKKFYLILITAVTFSSCIVHNPTTYIPVMPNNPMFENPDEVSISGGISFDHVEGQFGISPIR
ncbi:MAG TPA: hypothetical protein VD908_17760, partial [Cytophagales bacterium]|nr:hypothetical protein [Cytophagales bacterium]